MISSFSIKRTIFSPFLIIAAALYAQSFNHVTVIDSQFENGQLDGWTPRGSEKLELAKDIKHSGTSSLRVYNRSATWQGVQHILTDSPAANDSYGISAWIYFKDGPAVSAITLSIQRSFKDASKQNAYQNIDSFQAKKGEWTEIKAEYTVSADPGQANIWVYFEFPYKPDNMVTANDKLDFWLDDVKIIKLDPAARHKAEENIPNLAEVWRNSFGMGAAVSRGDVESSSPNAQLLIKHFNVLVAGNEQKPETMQPAEGNFNWEPADAIISFGEKNGMRRRWHTLVWHQQTPAWFFQDKARPSRPASKDVLNQRLKTHIQTIVRRYRGRVESYDVVNEVLSDRSGLRSGAEGSKWHEILGAEYIDNAFRWAREADPNAQLVINDYNLEYNPRKRQEMVNLIKGMKERGVPVDAVGLQMHIDIKNPSVSQIRETIETFAALGVKVMITELDISIYTGDREAKKAITDALLLEQAQRSRDIFAMLREQAAKGNLADMVIMWGITDADSWKNNYPVPGRTDAPLLFDTRLQSKPAFWGLVDPGKVQGLR